MGVQYAIFLSTDIKQRMVAVVITVKLKRRVTASAAILPKRIAEEKVPTLKLTKIMTILVLAAET
jgi:hypothetical protein